MNIKQVSLDYDTCFFYLLDMDKITFRSKIDWWFPSIIFISCLGMAIIIINDFSWVGLIICMITAAFLLDLLINTTYAIKGTELIIRSGIFIKTSIDINSISSIRQTKSGTSAPALSLDRVLIKYNKYSEIIISPKDLDRFIDCLNKINRNCTLAK